MLFAFIFQNVSKEARISRGNLWPAGVTFISLSALYLGRYRDKHQMDQKKLAESIFFPYISKRYGDGWSSSLNCYWCTFFYLVNLLSCLEGLYDFLFHKATALQNSSSLTEPQKTRWSNLLKQERVRSDCLWFCPVELLMGVFKGWDFCYLSEQFSQWLTNLVVGEGGSFPTSHQNFQCCNFCLLSLIPGSCRVEMTLPPPLLNLPIRSLNAEKPCPPPPKTEEHRHAASLCTAFASAP